MVAIKKLIYKDLLLLRINKITQMSVDIQFQLIEFYTENIFEKVAEEDNEYDNNDLDSDEDDIESESEDDIDTNKPSDNKGKQQYSREYKIYLFGRDAQNRTVSVLVNHFTPYYYIRIPEKWTRHDCEGFKNWILSQVDPKLHEGYYDMRINERRSFSGFSNNKEFRFIKLIFKNTTLMRKTIDIFIGRMGEGDDQVNYWKTYKGSELRRFGVPLENDENYEFQLYESNIDPLLRFLHLQDIEPCSWVQIPAGQYIETNETTSEIDIACNWNVIKPYKSVDNKGFVICSFDIETDSSHGDFPIAKKNYLKVVRDLVEYWQQLNKDIERLRTIRNRPPEQEALYLKCAEMKKNAKETLIKYFKDSFVADFDTERQNEVISNPGVFHIYLKKQEVTPSDLQIKKVVRNIESLATIVYTSANIKQKTFNIDKICTILNSSFPKIEGDRVRQIGLKFIRYGEKSCFKNILISYGQCDKITDTHVLNAQTEEHLLQTFTAVLHKYDPDFIIGYNIFNFDFPFLYDRAEELGILEDFCKLGRIPDKISTMVEKKGKVKTKFLEIPGRIQIDIYKILQREQPNLESYKLDNVCSHFIKSPIKRMERLEDGKTKLIVDDMSGIYADNYIHLLFQEGYTENKLEIGIDKKTKFRIIDAKREGKDNVLIIDEDVYNDINKYKYKLWSLAKDDLSPKELFRCFKGSNSDRALIGKYCMMDVNLCIELINKLQMITNNMGMANVCITPLNWIFMRGQGVKILSLISKFCKNEKYLLPTLLVNKGDGQKYEGAFVLPPIPGVYLDKYITVLDYNSLYPSSMIAENLSHETYCGAMCRCEDHLDIEQVTNKVFNYYENESLQCHKCIELNKDTPKNEWLGLTGIQRILDLGLGYEDIPHDIYQCTFTKTGHIKSKTKIGVRLCRFVQFSNNEKGILPRILKGLLQARKDTRTKMIFETLRLDNDEVFEGVVNDVDGGVIVKDINFKPISPLISLERIVERKNKYNDFMISVLEGLQLAFKVTANSLYGQIGAKTSAVFLKDIAASTTATGRKQLLTAKDYVETRYEGAKVIYGDTDSIFVDFQPRDIDGNLLTGKAGLERSIELGKEVSKGIRQELKNPQNLGYEKTFWPFIIFSKKRYVGNKYEEDPNKFKQASMGIVLKRRDNCPLVKIFFGGVIDILMNKRDYMAAKDYVDSCCNNLIQGEYPIEKLTISKMLNAHYKNPDQIAHKILADRIGERESGNKPQNGDRIPYVFIYAPEQKLQGNKIENPQYVIDHKLKLDYKYYITNQISKPVGQIFALFIEKLEPKRFKETVFSTYYQKHIKAGKDEYYANKKLMEYRLKLAIEFIFERFVNEVNNKQTGQSTLENWLFAPIKKN
jgi:DNA polymerase elongation subunit (family B)